MSQPESRPKIANLQPGGKIRVVEDGELRICIREVVMDGRRGPRLTAELTVLGGPREIAVVDARSAPDLDAALEHAVTAFAASVRMRRRASH